MALPSSGQISMSQINTELCLGSSTQISLNSSNVRTLFGKSSGQISLSDGWGKSDAPTPVGLTVTQYSVATIDISWTTTTLRYRIYRNSSLVYDSGTAITANSYSFTGLSDNTSYTIDVALVNSCGIEGTKATVVQSTRTRIANATGGTISYNGIYQYHKFTSSGTFTLTQRTVSSVFAGDMVGGGYAGSGGGGAYSQGGSGGGSGRKLTDTTSFTTNDLVLNTGYTVTVAGAGGGNSYVPNLWSNLYVSQNGTVGGIGGTGGGFGSGGNGNGGPGDNGYGGYTNLLGEAVAGGGGGGGGGAQDTGAGQAEGGTGGNGDGGGGAGGGGGGWGYPNGCGPFGNDGSSGANANANSGAGGGGGGSGSDYGIDDGCCYPCGNEGRATVGGNGGGGGSGVVIIRFAAA